MSIEKIHHEHTSVFGFKVTGKLTTDEIEAFLPEMEATVSQMHGRFRLLIDANEMHNAKIKAEWEIFEFLKKHIKDIEYIAIVGSHSWLKIMSEVLVESIFVTAETRYFEENEIKDAWTWLTKAIHPQHVPVRRVVNSDKGLFTKYSSPDYI